MTRPGENEASVMDRDDLRIGDAEREQTMAALREHFAQGRLTHEELDERLDQALTARTARDLARITSDLPGHGPARSETSPGYPSAPLIPPMPPMPPMAPPFPGHDLGSWQEAMRAHRKQMRAYHHQMRDARHQAKAHRHGPHRRHGHRGPGPIVPILFVFLMVGLFAGGFGVLKFVFVLVIAGVIFKIAADRVNRRR
ncbi:DUF1707 domain-containing protein [Nonomuraea sp. NPDC048826]|uniref:DUF1707 SHOCT-like domain-containing protein n=1 Tax=Nonomuraea sp. NPDC048826 TaxID=3364347 RepID=UPI003718B454